MKKTYYLGIFFLVLALLLVVLQSMSITEQSQPGRSTKS